jgi:hypothetical protein
MGIEPVKTCFDGWQITAIRVYGNRQIGGKKCRFSVLAN